MGNIVSKNILADKSKFFLTRIFTYFSFLLVPVIIQKSLLLDNFTKMTLMGLYVCFMAAQWFLLGKEIDHRLKIYFRVNSSIDRIVYRVFFGMTIFIIYFNLINLFPLKWANNLFWTTWALLGLFYSWPTRGKIIQESVTTNFSEFKYLDGFEKTLLLMILLLFVFSIPEFPILTDVEALKLFFDPRELIDNHFWVFLKMNYLPFYHYPELLKLSWGLHFYIIGMGLFLLTFYAFLRYFVSRRLALLGVFALVSSWSYSKILGNNFGSSILTTYSLLFVWAGYFTIKSSTYRMGLFLGLVGYLGVLINKGNIFLSVAQILFIFFFFLRDKTFWYRTQLLKYALFGLSLMIFIVATEFYMFENQSSMDEYWLMGLQNILSRKAFFSLSVLGFFITIFKAIRIKKRLFVNFDFDVGRLHQLWVYFFLLFLSTLFIDQGPLKDFGMMWPVAFLSLIPIDLIFQSITRLRSRRNIIYVTYILICLLDSHFEGRIKILLRIFEG